MKPGNWTKWLLEMRFTVSFIAAVSAIITLSSILAERGLIDPSDWEVAFSKPWGIVTSHFVNRDYALYMGNMIGLLVFAILYIPAFISASLLIHRIHANRVKWRLDPRFPGIVLVTAFAAALATWLGYVILEASGGGGGSGAGTSVMVSAAFGAGMGFCLGIAKTFALSLRDESKGNNEKRKVALVGLFVLTVFASLLATSELVIYDLFNPPIHGASFLFSGLLAFLLVSDL